MKTLVFIVCLLFFSFSFAADKDLEVVQRNLLELQQQFWNLEKALKTNNSEFQNTIRRVQTSTEELRENQAALNAKMETMLNQIQALQEKLDETNRRLKELAAARPILAPFVPESSQASSGPPSQSQDTMPPATGESGAQELQLFLSARAEYTKGRFEQALRGFQDYLDRYPGSSLADDAQFMIGESYYGMKEYVDAVSEYDKVMKEYPDSEHVPGARLKKAFSLQALGKKGQAVMELQTILARHPQTKEAQIARQRLAEFGLE